MTTYEFGLLNVRDQVDLLYREGVYAGKRREGTCPVVLYQLDGFYVEVYYLKYRREIQRMHCFNSTAHLAPYLQQIDIKPLVHC